MELSEFEGYFKQAAFYKNDRVILFKGDSAELVPLLPDKCIDLVAVDPPYDLHQVEDSGGGCFHDSIRKIRGHALAEIADSYDVPFFFAQWNRVCIKPQGFVFCSNYQILPLLVEADKLDLFWTILVWWKTNATPFASGTWRSNAEFVVHYRSPGATFEGGVNLKSKVHPIAVPRSEWGHPTEKPIQWFTKFLLIATYEDEIVLDTHAGSGTTGAAAMALKRRAVLIEKEEGYCNAIAQRLSQPYLDLRPSSNPTPIEIEFTDSGGDKE